MNPERGLRSGGMTGWLLQRLTGILLMPVVIAHLLVTHYMLGNPARGALDVRYGDVAARLASPWWKLLDLLFLGVVLYHGLRGVWVVLQEGIEHPWARVTIYSAVLLLGVVLAVLGTVTILPFRAS